MIERTMKIRVNYYDTDQMGYVHHSNYVKYYESARIDLMRKIGVPYSEIEKTGIMLPVIDLQIKYIRPAFFEDVLMIKTTLEKVTSVRVVFTYQMFNESDELLNEGTTTLAFVSKETRKLCDPPKDLLEKLQVES